MGPGESEPPREQMSTGVHRLVRSPRWQGRRCSGRAAVEMDREEGQVR